MVTALLLIWLSLLTIGWIATTLLDGPHAIVHGLMSRWMKDQEEINTEVATFVTAQTEANDLQRQLNRALNEQHKLASQANDLQEQTHQGLHEQRKLEEGD